MKLRELRNADEVDFSKMRDTIWGEYLVSALPQADFDLVTGAGRLLMNGFMNRQALDKTLDTGLVTFFSRSSGQLWTKGETSSNTLEVISGIYVDCDYDSLVIPVRANGPTCHTGAQTCFVLPLKGEI